MFYNADDLKTAVLASTPEDFFDDHLTGGHSRHFSEAKLEHFCTVFSDSFETDVSKDSVVMVGSAKLGFALHEKKKSDQTLKAFRPFSDVSDIDLTICNHELFKKIWYELSAHACLQNYMPWNPKKLADYLLYGWLRPDKFPKGVALTHCDRFYETIGRLRRDRTNGHPAISVALFYSTEQLKRYQTRSIKACKIGLEAA